MSVDPQTLDAGRAARLHGLPLLGLLLVLAAIGYGDTLGDFFLSDDFGLLRVAYGAPNFLEAAGLGAHGAAEFLRPVVRLAWWANHALFGLSPVSFHVANTLFHVLNAWLLAWVVFRLTRHRLASWAAGAAFVVYPIHPEAVTWVSGRVDVIATTGYLAALAFWVRFVQGPGRVSHLIGSAFCFAIALLSKEMAATLPVAAVVIAVACSGRSSRTRRVLGVGLLCLVFAGYLGGRFALLGSLGGYRTAEGTNLHRLADVQVAMRFVKNAGRQAVAPAIRARHPDTFDPLRAMPLIAVALAAVITATGGGGRRMAGQFLAGMILFYISLGPLLGWAGLGKDGQSARFLYLPSAFACAMLAAAFLDRADRPARRYALTAFAVVWVGVYLIGLCDANRPWREAARMTRTIVDTAVEHSQAGPGVQSLVVTDLPDNHEGAYVFRNCIEQAVFLFHPHRLAVIRLPRAGWEKARAMSRSAGVHHQLFLRWDTAAGAWRED